VGPHVPKVNQSHQYKFCFIVWQLLSWANHCLQSSSDSYWLQQLQCKKQSEVGRSHQKSKRSLGCCMWYTKVHCRICYRLESQEKTVIELLYPKVFCATNMISWEAQSRDERGHIFQTLTLFLLLALRLLLQLR